MNESNNLARRLLLTACLISFCCFLGSYMRIPIVPLLATSLGADTAQVGMINGAFMLVAGAMSIPSGLLSDRLGRRVPLLGGLTLLALSSLLLYWSQSPLQMGLIYLFFGMGLSAFSPTLMSYVADVTPPETIGQAYGLYTMALYGGMTLGPAAGGFVGTALGLRTVFLVSAGIIFAMLLVAVFFLPVQPPHRHHERPALLPQLRELMANRRLLACLAGTGGGCIGFGMFVTFMPLYIRSRGLGTMEVGAVFATQALSNALSRVPSGKLYDKVQDKSLLVSGGLAIFAVALGSFQFFGKVLPLVAVAAVMGVSMGVAFTVIGALIADVVARPLRGLAMGCYNTSVYAGMMVSSVGVGHVIRGYGFNAGFSLSAAAVAVVMLLFGFLYHRAA
ncbi:MFS transporter [Geomonas sp. Red32]|uniref:MFS transporter n=1 Tax=Geomonas sp. Red32 TaxID=2912856 RepID=UPI00202CC07D|nr:MFS transporter [Geomonas sp. Red32]